MRGGGGKRTGVGDRNGGQEWGTGVVDRSGGRSFSGVGLNKLRPLSRAFARLLTAFVLAHTQQPLALLGRHAPLGDIRRDLAPAPLMAD